MQNRSILLSPVTIPMIGRLLIALLLLVSPNALRAGETDKAPKKTEFPSPDRRFAFRYSGDKSEDEVQTYDLIDKASRKVVTKVAESDPDAGPSMRFTMEKALWRADSKAFAVTAFLWKRGTSLLVFERDGAAFRQIELPELAWSLVGFGTLATKTRRLIDILCSTAFFGDNPATVSVKLHHLLMSRAGDRLKERREL
jgi:hypothetical protein